MLICDPASNDLVWISVDSLWTSSNSVYTKFRHLNLRRINDSDNEFVSEEIYLKFLSEEIYLKFLGQLASLNVRRCIWIGNQWRKSLPWGSQWPNMLTRNTILVMYVQTMKLTYIPSTYIAGSTRWLSADQFDILSYKWDMKENKIIIKKSGCTCWHYTEYRHTSNEKLSRWYELRKNQTNLILQFVNIFPGHVNNIFYDSTGQIWSKVRSNL